MTTVYLIGTPKGAAVNQYESMTNSRTEAERLLAELGEGVIKEVTVKPRRGR